MTARPDPALVRECFAENRERLLGTINVVSLALAEENRRRAQINTVEKKHERTSSR